MGPVGIREILVIFLIILVLFGAKRIPELARGMGQGIREFKNSVKDEVPERTEDDRETKSSV